GDTRVSYFLGRDSRRWRPDVPTYEQVSLGDVWPGIAVTLRRRDHGVEKIFTLRPGAAVERIRVRVAGAYGLSVDGDGVLLARTGWGVVTSTAPVAYQEHGGARR